MPSNIDGPRGRSRLHLAMLLSLLFGGFHPGFAQGTPGGPQSSQDEADSKTLGKLNSGLPRLDDPPDLETPQSSLESFISSCRAGDLDRAARSLNLEAIEPEHQAAR